MTKKLNIINETDENLLKRIDNQELIQLYQINENIIEKYQKMQHKVAMELLKRKIKINNEFHYFTIGFFGDFDKFYHDFVENKGECENSLVENQILQIFEENDYDVNYTYIA